MLDEKKHKSAYERAARAIHESYYGAGTWKTAGTPERSHARQAVRLCLSAMEKVGVNMVEGGSPKAPPSPAPARVPAPRRF